MNDAQSSSKKDLIDFDLNCLWHPFTQMEEWSQQDPLFITRGEGNYLIDLDGNRYLDGVSSLWANIHGHGRREINAAIEEQLRKISHTTLLGLSHPNAAILAQRLSSIAPGKLKRVFYSESGSTAVEIAIKMAFQYWQNIGQPAKKKFICLQEGYHGDTIGSVSVGGIDLFHQIYSPLLFDSIKIPSPYMKVLEDKIPFERGAEHCANEVEKILRESHSETAALILEPLVQGAGGILPFPPGYLKRVSEFCKTHDVLLIADEVAVGFGRTGTMFACEQERVEPDLICLGKGLTGGYLPLAATLTTERIFEGFQAEYDALKTFFHGHTFTGNPLACSAALASLDLFHSDRILEKLPRKIDALREGLKSLSQTDFVGDIRQCGLMAGVELFEDWKNRVPFPMRKRIGHRVCMDVRRHGIILRNLGDVVVFMPPLSVTEDEIIHLIDSVEKSIHEICG